MFCSAIRPLEIRRRMAYHCSVVPKNKQGRGTRQEHLGKILLGEAWYISCFFILTLFANNVERYWINKIKILYTFWCFNEATLIGLPFFCLGDPVPKISFLSLWKFYPTNDAVLIEKLQSFATPVSEVPWINTVAVFS